MSSQEEKKPQEKKTQEKGKKPQEKKPQEKAGDKSKNLLGIDAPKTENFSEWYQQVVTKAELIEYYDISGCYIFRPSSYAIWEEIQHFFDGEIKKLGVKNAYFPLMVSEKALTAEKDHVEGFAPEVAWVTEAGEKKLNEKIAIRPTSETIMYPAYATWIRSHRDLPLKLNQWTNVVRWEFKHPVPFIRSREFLWQEGHSAFATNAEADVEVLQILELYRRVYEELLAVPVIKGRKSEKEKFAGGLYTTTVEAFIATNGRGIQAATSHCLGQNFSKMFNIVFENENEQKSLVWQNSWGLTTRTIGIMIMTHGDDKGLIIPPRVAPVQIVIIPLHFKGKSPEEVNNKAKEIAKELRDAGLRVEVDDRDMYNPGYKYNHWELRGVPIRIEIGPKDIEKSQVMAARRDNGAKESIAFADVVSRSKSLLSEIQAALFEKAKKERDDHIKKVTSWADFVPTLNQKNIILAPWCDEVSCENDVKQKSSDEAKQFAELQAQEETGFRLTGAAKTLCIPFDQEPIGDHKCFHCGKEAKKWTLWGRSY